jgi:transcriptional regulator with XRE-family HTH domain
VPTESNYRGVCKRVAALLKAERERQGLSMTMLAGRAGLSQPSLSYLEHGLRIPNLDTLLRITDALGIELSTVIARATTSPNRGKR